MTCCTRRNTFGGGGGGGGGDATSGGGGGDGCRAVTGGADTGEVDVGTGGADRGGSDADSEVVIEAGAVCGGMIFALMASITTLFLGGRPLRFAGTAVAGDNARSGCIFTPSGVKAKFVWPGKEVLLIGFQALRRRSYFRFFGATVLPASIEEEKVAIGSEGAYHKYKGSVLDTFSFTTI
jgi:hypothetical protein